MGFKLIQIRNTEKNTWGKTQGTTYKSVGDLRRAENGDTQTNPIITSVGDLKRREYGDAASNPLRNTTTKSAASKSSSSKSSGGGGGSSYSMPADSTDPKSSTGKAQKKQNKKAYYSLEGQLEYLPTKKTIKMKAGDTIKLKGIGAYLSGSYYVGEVTRTIDATNGYSQTAQLYKPNFRKTLKAKKKKKKKPKKGESS